MTGEAVPFLPRGVRRHFDKVRGVPVLLGPERVLMLDEIGCAILDCVDGTNTLDKIATTLAQAYDAPVEAVAADVNEFLTGLADKNLLEQAHG